MTKPLPLLFCALLLLTACTGSRSPGFGKGYGEPVDPDATPETRALFGHLLHRQGEGILFGHQDSPAYGIGWQGGAFSSDVRKTSGKFPAVFGWDAGDIGQGDRNLDQVKFSDMRNWMIEVYKRGGVNTLSWHLDNPVSGGDAWDVTPAVRDILPGGSHHSVFLKSLDALAGFLDELRTEDGTAVPVIFRPWHENNSSWFWWGADHCSPAEFKQLFRFTVEYLTRKKGLHHLLFCYSPDVVGSERAYLKRYPGDDVVDVLGLCDYTSFYPHTGPGRGFESLRIVGVLSIKKQKPFALVETGVDQLNVPEWWTEHLLRVLMSDSLTSRISYLLVWRNASPDHFFGPYPGHPAAENFAAFADDPATLFLEDLPDLYRPFHPPGSPDQQFEEIAH